MARHRNGKRKSRAASKNELALFDEPGLGGFSRAFHSHIEDLSYELLKDPEYREWMNNWLEGFLSLTLRKLRDRKKIGTAKP